MGTNINKIKKNIAWWEKITQTKISKMNDVELSAFEKELEKIKRGLDIKIYQVWERR
jgi:predicted HTH domain antitoxin